MTFTVTNYLRESPEGERFLVISRLLALVWSSRVHGVHTWGKVVEVAP